VDHRYGHQISVALCSFFKRAVQVLHQRWFLGLCHVHVYISLILNILFVLRVSAPAWLDSCHTKTARKSKACGAGKSAPNSALPSYFFRLATSIPRIAKQKIPSREIYQIRDERETVFLVSGRGRRNRRADRQRRLRLMIILDLVGYCEPLHDLVDLYGGLIANTGLRNEDDKTLDSGDAVSSL
jgi:hypothetical protein